MHELLNTSNCDPVHLGTTKVNCLLCADDLVLLSQSRSGLEESLTQLESYIERWRLEINQKKSKMLIFGSKSQRNLVYITSKWCFGGELLQCADEYVYLGVTLVSPFHIHGGQTCIFELLIFYITIYFITNQTLELNHGAK